MDELVLYLHVLGVLVFAAGVAVAGVAFESARRRERSDEIALLLRQARAGALLVVSGGALLLVCGLWLVALEEGIDYGTGWVDAAIALFALALLLGELGGRGPRHARRLASRLAQDGAPPNAELHRLLDDPRARAANYASAAIVLAILALMVFKP
jgi:uncharacterized membrane protein